MNRKIPFSFLVNTGRMWQKYPIAIVLKSLFEEIMATRKHKYSNVFHRGVPSIGASRR
jgi:hypothetical protein